MCLKLKMGLFVFEELALNNFKIQFCLYYLVKWLPLMFAVKLQLVFDIGAVSRERRKHSKQKNWIQNVFRYSVEYFESNRGIWICLIMKTSFRSLDRWSYTLHVFLSPTWQVGGSDIRFSLTKLDLVLVCSPAHAADSNTIVPVW